MRLRWAVVAVGGLLLSSTGCSPGIFWACARPEVTAVSLNPCDGHLCGKETGVPFYLPKPLLIVSKNFRNVETMTTGLTDSPPIPGAFDDQAKYADVNARTNFVGLNPGTAPAPPDGGGGRQSDPIPTPGKAYKSAPTLHSSGAPVSPGKAPADGLAPDTFFTYQVVFVPDMTRRYGLKIRGGPGEIRAAMNLVNGWQFTGIGPFYMKDSATAQNILAQGINNRLTGQAAADVINASADLAKVAGVPGGGLQSGLLGADDARVQRLSEALGALPANTTPLTLVDYAEIHVYEPNVTPDGRMEWCEIVNLRFNRDYLGVKTTTAELAPHRPPVIEPRTPGGGLQSGALLGPSDDVARTAVAGLFGVPAGSPALAPAPGGGLQSGVLAGPTGVPAGGVNQIQVDCGGKDVCRPARQFNLFNFGHGKKDDRRPTVQTRTLSGGTVFVPGLPNLPAVEDRRPVTAGAGGPVGQGLQGGVLPNPTPVPAIPPIINQPIFNHQAAPIPAAKEP
ncbi:MAG: hypothetical protein K2X87_32750 [Gemmataceae bacterium]|nr:hypothetical protein [Gemmataceae bacterium]